MQLVDPGDLAAARGVELLLPPAHLPLEEALGPAEVAQPDRLRVDRVQRDEGVDHPLADRAGPLRPERLELGREAVGRARRRAP